MDGSIQAALVQCGGGPRDSGLNQAQHKRRGEAPARPITLDRLDEERRHWGIKTLIYLLLFIAVNLPDEVSVVG